MTTIVNPEAETITGLFGYSNYAEAEDRANSETLRIIRIGMLLNAAPSLIAETILYTSQALLGVNIQSTSDFLKVMITQPKSTQKVMHAALHVLLEDEYNRLYTSETL